MHSEPVYAARPSSAWKRLGWACLFWVPAAVGLVAWIFAAFVREHTFAVAVVLGFFLPLGFLTCWVVGLVLHEFAHYMIARCVKAKLLCFSIGHGALLWQWKGLGGMAIAIRAIPFCGYISFSRLNQSWFRGKVFAVAAAGPLANAILAAAAWKLLVDEPYWWSKAGLTDWMHLFLPVFSFFNALLAISALVPYKGSDGRHLLNVLFRWDPQQGSINWANVSEWLAAAQTSTTSGPADRQETDAASTMVNTHDPNEFLLSYREMLDHPDMPPHIREGVLDIFATTVLFFDAREYLADADGYSRELFELKPNEWTVQGTRGSVLIELGRVDEGMAMLLRVVENDPKPFDQAIAAAYLALGELRRGNLEAAAEWIEKARAFDPNCVPMKRIAANIGEAGPGSGDRLSRVASQSSDPISGMISGQSLCGRRSRSANTALIVRPVRRANTESGTRPNWPISARVQGLGFLPGMPAPKSSKNPALAQDCFSWKIVQLLRAEGRNRTGQSLHSLTSTLKSEIALLRL